MCSANIAGPHPWWNIDDWFHLSDYKVFSDLGATGWSRILWEMAICDYESADIESGFLAPGEPEPIRVYRKDARRWWRYRGTQPPFSVLSEPEPPSRASSGTPLEELRVELRADGDGVIGVIEDAEMWAMFPAVCPAIKVDLRCPDAVLVEAFRRWVIDRRQAMPLPITQRGRPGALVPAIKDQFRIWHEYRIAAVYDVDFWATVRNQFADNDQDRVAVDRTQGNLPTAEVARLVFPDLRSGLTDMERAQHVSNARRVLREALDIQSSVALQAKSEIR